MIIGFAGLHKHFNLFKKLRFLAESKFLTTRYTRNAFEHIETR